MTRPTKDTYFLRMAELVATRATCLRRQAGCVLVDRFGHVLATGYNGRPAGFNHCNHVEKETFETAAEAGRRYGDLFRAGEAANLDTRDLRGGHLPGDDADPAVYRWPHPCRGAAAASGSGLDGCEAVHAEQNALLQCPDVQEIRTVYVTVSPCIHCVKMLLNTGATTVLFREPYPHDETSRQLWEDHQRGWIHHPHDEMEA
ncbi:MAG TPA: hypothetical protein VKA48_03830 [Gammaproteobacteria bacterium]|nr:hypothetical protein [Gammaproteobacteria bacterium]